MHLTLQLLIMTLLAAIFIEDLRHRAVHWFWFPLLGAGLLISRSLSSISLNQVFTHIGFNLLFLSAQLLLVTLYFSIKRRRLTNITLDLLGWGDILLLLCLTLYLGPVNFIAFYILSLIAVLIGWLLYQALISKPAATLPLAGLQALLFAFMLGIAYLHNEVQLTNDHWLLTYLA